MRGLDCSLSLEVKKGGEASTVHNPPQLSTVPTETLRTHTPAPGNSGLGLREGPESISYLSQTLSPLNPSLCLTSACSVFEFEVFSTE